MKYSTTKESYSEVYEIINCLDDEYKNKIPKKLYNFIENNRDKKYIPKFNLNKNLESLNETSISRKAVAIMAYLNLKYWTEDENEIEKLKKIYSNDQMRFEEEVIENYDEEFLLNSCPDLGTEETVLPVLYKEKWYMKILRYIKSFFMKNKKSKKSEKVKEDEEVKEPEDNKGIEK